MAYVLAFTLDYEGVVRVHDAVLCLAKFGERVSLEARHDRLTLTALNLSKSAYASFRLDRNAFFEKYNYSPSEAQSQQVNDEIEARFTCQLYNKALLSVFKGRLGDNNRERDTAVEKCEVFVEHETDNAECRLMIKMICRHGVIKTYRLTYEAVEVMHALFDKKAAKNRWRIGSNVLRTFTEYFGAGTEQLDIYSEEGRVAFTSYTEKIMNEKGLCTLSFTGEWRSRLTEILKHPLHTSVAIDVLDFEEFSVEQKLRIGISVKDFKAIVMHAERIKASISAFYSYPNRPMQLTYHHHGMLCEFTLMTIGEYRGSSATPAPANVRSVSRVPSEQQHSRQASRQPSVQPPGPSTSQALAQAQTSEQRNTASMPPPTEPASRSSAKIGVAPRPHRSTPPPPKASLDPESLFLPADDEEEDRLWGDRSYDNEQDVLGWNSHANASQESFSQSFHSLRQDQEAPTGPGFSRAWPADNEMHIPPTQKLSDVRGLLDDD